MPGKSLATPFPCAYNAKGAPCAHFVAKQGTTCVTCRNRKYRAKDPVKYAWWTLKTNARRRGKEFLLTLEQFRAWPLLNRYMTSKGTGPDDLTIDRIKEEEGYHINNIQILRNVDNVIKKRRHEGFVEAKALMPDE